MGFDEKPEDVHSKFRHEIKELEDELANVYAQVAGLKAARAKSKGKIEEELAEAQESANKWFIRAMDVGTQGQKKSWGLEDTQSADAARAGERE